MKKIKLFFFFCFSAFVTSSFAQVLLHTNLENVNESILPYTKTGANTQTENLPQLNWKFIPQTKNLPNYVPGEIYVKFKEDAKEYKNIKVDANGKISFFDIPFLKDIFSKYQVEEFYHSFVGADSPFLQSSFRMKIADDSKIEQVIKELSAKNYIETVVKVPLFKVFLTPNDPYYAITSTFQGYSLKWNWYLTKINAAAAWDISTGSSTVKVAIVDNAVYTSHPDLSSKIVAQYDVADNDNNANPPTSVTSETSRYTWSHGTHAAGLAGAITNNNVGIASIGYNVSLIAIKCTKNSASPEALTGGYEGVQKAADLGANVINMSFGGPMTSQTEKNYGQGIMNYAYNKGCVLVAAAGNEGDQGNEINYPANFNHVIAVGATNGNDAKAGFSQYGSWIDVMAPGGNDVLGGQPFLPLLSTTWSQAYGLKSIYGLTTATSNPFLNTYYDGMQGTSMAAPIVAGLAGLIKSAKSTLTADQIANCIISTADNINSANPNYIGKIGSGRINAKAALECAVGSSTPPGPDPGTNTACDTVNFIKAQSGTWTSSNYTYGTESYIFGVNNYADKETFQHFNLTGNTATNISGVVVGLTAMKVVGSKSIKINVYNDNAGTPGTLIGSTTYNVSTTANPSYVVFNLTNSLAIPANKKFFVGVDYSALSFNAGDRLGIFSNKTGQSTPSDAYVKESDNSIKNIDAALQNPLNVSVYIFPIVTGTPSATITASTNNISCNKSVTFQATGVTNVSNYAWTFENGNPATAATQSASTTFSTNGTHTVTLEVKNSCGGSKTITSTVTVTDCNNNNIGVNEVVGNAISSYFAPVSNEFVIDFNLIEQQDFSFRIINSLGQVLFNGKVNISEGASTYRINANMFPAGMYVLQLLNKNTQYSNKMIVR